MATSDQLQRLESAAFDFELRFFAGGKYGYMDLAGIETGATWSLPSSTELTADIDPSSTVIPVDDTTGFTGGTILIHPHEERPEEEFELVAYAVATADEFQQLQRGDMQTAYSGTHLTGATVSEWYEITNKITDISSLEVEDKGGWVDWRATISGLGYDSVLLDNDNAILCLWRFSPKDGAAGTWTDWEVGFLGYVREFNLTDTSRQEKSFRLTIGGLGMYLGSTDLDAQHFGRTDLAEGKSVTVSSLLFDPALEANSGEFVGSPEFSGSNLVDDDIGTLWISDGEPSLSPGDSPLASYFSINEVYMTPEPGYLPADYQWVEIHYKAGDKDRQMRSYSLVSSCTTWHDVDWHDEQGNKVGEATLPLNNFVELDAIKMLSDDGSFAIIASNLPRFLERWSAHGASYVIDWRRHMIGDFEIDPTGDFLAILYVGNVESVVWWYGGRVAWGLYDFRNDGGGSGWTGDMVNVMSLPAGHSIRRSPTGNKSDPDHAGNWVADESHPTPGAYVTGDPEWAMVDLGEMGITLEAELAIDEVDEMEISSTLGLTEGPAYVQIDSEIIKYETRDVPNDKLLTLTRAQYTTEAAVHPGPPSPSTVLQFENLSSTGNYQISSLSWRRRPVIASGTNRPNVPEWFEVYVTTLAGPITPDSDDWEDDWEDYWTRIMVEPACAETFWQRTFDPVRARKVLITIHQMTDGGRVKLNSLQIYAAQVDVESGDGSTSDLDAHYTGHLVRHLLTNQMGLSASLFTLTDEGRQFQEMDLTKGTAERVLRDLCQRSGCQLVFGMDHRVEHRYDPLYPLSVLADIEVEWDRDNARKVELDGPYKHNVSQVTLRAKDPNSDNIFEATYPPTPMPYGSVVNQEGFILGSADDAKLMAQHIFHQRNGPYKVSLTAVGPAEWLRPGMRCTVTWEADEEGTLLQGHNFVIASIHYSVQLGKVRAGDKGWVATVRLKELEF